MPHVSARQVLGGRSFRDRDLFDIGTRERVGWLAWDARVAEASATAVAAMMWNQIGSVCDGGGNSPLELEGGRVMGWRDGVWEAADG